MTEPPGWTADSVVAEHHAWLLRLARGLAADEAGAEDLAQEAWAQVLARGAAAARDLGAYLGGVVRVLAARERTAARARGVREECAARAEALPSAARLAERLELARVLAEELGRLPERTRTLLLLHHQEGVPLSSIAASRGVAASTVRADLSRARALLRERLDRRFGERRAGWAALALSGAEVAAGPTITGAMAMHAGLKVAVAASALWLAGWWWMRERGSAPGPAEGPAATTVALAPSERAPAVAAREPLAVDGEAAEPGAAPASAPATADLAVHLRDSRTAEPLPRYAVLVRPGASADDDEGELVASDADGVLGLTAREHPLPVVLRAVDHPEDWCDFQQERRIEREALAADGAPLVVELLAGPTYALQFTARPPDGEELLAQLDASAAPDPGDGNGFRTRVRPGELPWVRFDPADAMLGEGPWTLMVRDRHGLWLASGPVRQIAGVQAEPVVMEASARGALSVTLTSEGAPVDVHSHVSVYRTVDGEVVDRDRTLQLDPRSHGRGTLRLLEPGTYRVFGRSRGGTAARTEATVLAGAVTELELDLPPRPELAQLEVLARSRTGERNVNAFGLAFHARAVDAEGKAAEVVFAVSRWVENRSDGSTLHVFDALPPGEYEVELQPTPHLPPWETRVQRTTAGGAPLVFTCLDEDAPPVVRSRVRVVDAQSGAPLALAGVTAYMEHRGHYLQTTDEAGEAALGPYPVGLEIEVHARAPGHVSKLVTLRVAEGAEPLVIALETGWGTLLDVHGIGVGPMEGVRVLLDGVHAATTDEHGRALVSAARRPERIDFERPGWRLQYGNVDPRTGAPSAGEQHAFWIVLERASDAAARR